MNHPVDMVAWTVALGSQVRSTNILSLWLNFPPAQTGMTPPSCRTVGHDKFYQGPTHVYRTPSWIEFTCTLRCSFDLALYSQSLHGYQTPSWIEFTCTLRYSFDLALYSQSLHLYRITLHLYGYMDIYMDIWVLHESTLHALWEDVLM